MKKPLAAGALAALLACAQSTPAPQTAAAPTAEYGMSIATAVEVCRPAGQRAYLRRLRCPDGSAPTFSRSGSGPSRTLPKTPEEEKLVAEQMFRQGPLKPGEADYHVIDYYDVRCGDHASTVIMDMYHCAQPEPTQAPPGFTIE